MLITKFKLLISMCIYFACMPSVVDAETYYPGAGGRMGIIDYYTDEEPSRSLYLPPMVTYLNQSNQYVVVVKRHCLSLNKIC